LRRFVRLSYRQRTEELDFLSEEGKDRAMVRTTAAYGGANSTRNDPDLGEGVGALDQLDAIETASRDELAALQLERLRRTVAVVYDRVAHCRNKFDAAGVQPGDLKELADLARFPFTTKDDLRQTYPFGMFAAPMEQIVRVHASSGTTGKPTVVGYTKADIDTWANLIARSLRAAGGRSTDKLHIAYGYGLFTGGLGFHYGGERLGATVIPAGGGFTERQVQLINDLRPDIIAVTPSYMLAIADEFARQGFDAKDCSLRVGIFGAEPWTESMRNEIEQRMGLAALDHYGLSEAVGPGVAQECLETKDGLTLWEDHFFPEIIDPDTGQVLPEGQEGELVLTTLTKEAMPVVRYRTRDLTRFLPGSARAMRRIERIKGRSDDMLIIRGVNVFPSQIEAVLITEKELAPHYVLEVRRDGRLDSLDVLVETRPEFAGRLNDAEQAALARQAQHRIKNFVGVSASVRVVGPGVIERSEGKAKRVIDRRPKN
jgi:phenylacetate-CoA ligase